MIYSLLAASEAVEVQDHYQDDDGALVGKEGCPQEEPKKQKAGKTPKFQTRFNGHWIKTPEGLKFVIDRTWLEEDKDAE